MGSLANFWLANLSEYSVSDITAWHKK